MATVQNAAISHADHDRRLPDGIVWDQVVFAELEAELGQERTKSALIVFSNILATKLDVVIDYSSDFQRRRHEAHDLASMSGFLGFDELFQACLALLASNRASLQTIDRVTMAIEAALEAIQIYLGSRIMGR